MSSLRYFTTLGILTLTFQVILFGLGEDSYQDFEGQDEFENVDKGDTFKTISKVTGFFKLVFKLLTFDLVDAPFWVQIPLTMITFIGVVIPVIRLFIEAVKAVGGLIPFT